MKKLNDAFGYEVTAEELKQYITYDPDTGIMRWGPKGRAHAGGYIAEVAGQPAGFIRSRYMAVKIKRVTVYAHRLAWFLTHEYWPEHCVDHINRDPLDNRLVNLREATFSQNAMNAKLRHDSKSNRKGVSFRKARNKWEAYIKHNGVKLHLGEFSTFSGAMSARIAAEQKLFGPYA